jgi:hypothetical protein
MKTDVKMDVTTDASQTCKAIKAVTFAVNDLKKAIDQLNETSITISIQSESIHHKRWYQFWK